MKKRNVIYNHQVLFFFMYDEFQNFIEKFEHRLIFNTFDKHYSRLSLRFVDGAKYFVVLKYTCA